MDTRKRRAGQLNLPRFRLCTRFRPDDGQTPSAERECFQRRCEGGQLLSGVGFASPHRIVGPFVSRSSVHTHAVRRRIART